MSVDARYTVGLEWTGEPEKLHVVRFNGAYLIAVHTRKAALEFAVRHNNARLFV